MRRKKSPLAGLLGITLTAIWQGGFCASPTRSTVQRAEIPGWVDARRGRRAAWRAPQTSRRRATPGNDLAQAGPDHKHLSGPAVCCGSPLRGGGVYRCAVRRGGGLCGPDPGLQRSPASDALPRTTPPALGRGSPSVDSLRRPCRLPRAVRTRADPLGPGLEGTERCGSPAWTPPGMSSWRRSWPMSGSIPAKT